MLIVVPAACREASVFPLLAVCCKVLPLGHFQRYESRRSHQSALHPGSHLLAITSDRRLRPPQSGRGRPLLPAFSVYAIFFKWLLSGEYSFNSVPRIDGRFDKYGGHHPASGQGIDSWVQKPGVEWLGPFFLLFDAGSWADGRCGLIGVGPVISISAPRGQSYLNPDILWMAWNHCKIPKHRLLDVFIAPTSWVLARKC